MTPDIVDHYDDLASAVEADEFDAAEEALTALGDAYDERSPEELRRVSRALTARDAGVIDYEDQERVDDLGIRYGRTEQTRGAVLSSTTLYLAAPDDSGKSDVLDTLSESRSREVDLESALSEVESLLSGVTVPGRLEFVRTIAPDAQVPKEETVTVGVDAENVGDEPIEGTTVTQESPLSLAPQSESTDELAGGESVRVSFEGPADVSGQNVVEFEATGDVSHQVLAEVDVSVLDKQSATEDGGDLLTELISLVDDSKAVTGGLERSLLKLLATADRSVDRALALVEKDDGDGADRKLETAIRKMGAILNRLAATSRGGSGDNVPNSLVQKLQKTAESVINRLTLAKQAAI